MTSQMLKEIREIPNATARIVGQSGAVVDDAANRMRDLDPKVLVTIARGSSDHAATYLKYAYEITLGVPVASVGPSVASIYGAQLRLPQAGVLAISQSGQSPDIVEMCASAGRGGALTVAITNDPASPLGDAADMVFPLLAGPETSVAATKTYVTTVVAGLMLLARWTQDAALQASLEALPAQLEQALACDWSPFCDAVERHEMVFAIGRGTSFAVCQEAALKLKEVCQINALSYSSAEVLHGPVSIVSKGTPVLAFAVEDAARAATQDVCRTLTKTGAQVFTTGGSGAHVTALPVVDTGHSLTAPLAQIVSFYVMVETLALAKGLDPDAPRHLSKVTKTV